MTDAETNVEAEGMVIVSTVPVPCEVLLLKSWVVYVTLPVLSVIGFGVSSVGESLIGLMVTVKLTVGADEDGRLLALRSRIVADAGGYHTTSAKCALRAACHSTGVYRIPNVDVEAKAVYTNNPNAGAMRGFGSNQAQFAMEGIMDVLAERVGVDGWDIRDRNILNPGDAFGTGQIMHSRDARVGEARLQEREVQRDRLRHQEHGPRQRHDRRRIYQVADRARTAN